MENRWKTQIRHSQSQQIQEPKTDLFDASNLDTTRDNLRVHLRPTKLVQLGLRTANLAREDLRQQGGHVRVHHWCEQLGVHRRMSESFLESVADVIRTARMDLGHTKLILSRHVVGEIRDEGAIDVQFEDDDEKNRRYGGDPV